MRKTLLSLKTLLLLTLLASVFSLGAAYVAELGFGLKPCHLCLLQRIPYGLVIVVALAGVWKMRYGRYLALLIVLCFLTGSAIAGYHTAVEKHWVEGPSGCTQTETKSVQTMDEFLKRIEQAPIILCDQPQWEWHGWTMASLNGLWSFALALGTFVALRHLPRGKEGTHV